MPTINLPEQKNRKYYKESEKSKLLNHSAVYNTRIWRSLRLNYLIENTLCEKCLIKNKITLATDIHHLYPISKGVTKEEKQIIGFDVNNLMSLCKACHIDIHNE